MGVLGGKEAKNLSKNGVHTLPVSTLYTHTQTVPKDYYTERLSYRVIPLPPCTKDFLMSLQALELPSLSSYPEAALGTQDTCVLSILFHSNEGMCVSYYPL